MRKQFSQFKDFVHNNLSRNDKNDVLNPELLKAEKHVENIKHALITSEKKLSNSLLSTTSDSSTATPERKIKKIPSSSLSTFFNDASDLLATSKPNSVLGKTLHLCSQYHRESITILTDYETEVEQKCIEKIQAFINEDLPSLSRARKLLNRTNAELNSLQTKYESSLKAVQNSQLVVHSNDSKIESLRKDVEDCQQKLYQFRDSYESEIFKFMSKELDISEIFSEYINLQASYHERMLNEIKTYIPLIGGVLANTSQKPVFGVPLEDHLSSSGRKISLVIDTCISHLLSSKNEEGLFRISGSTTKIKLLENAFNAGLVDNSHFNYDVHTIASTLKKYLRELPEPLLTFNLCNDWIQAASESDLNNRLQALWKVCNSLPEANKDNLCYLVKFLNQLTKHSESNKMSSQNIAIAIGPSLFRAPGDAMEISMSSYSPIIIEALITYCDYFFTEEVIFRPPSKNKMIDSCASDNSDQDISIVQKQTVNYRKKPAPKPPSQLFQENSNSLESNASKIKSKFGSLRLKSTKPTETSKNPFEKPSSQVGQPRVDSPPAKVAQIATIRRNVSPRFDAKSRPSSTYERPHVPPPEVPPRPSIMNKVNTNEQVAELNTNENLDVKQNDEKQVSDGLNSKEEQIETSDKDSNNSLRYPSLEDFDEDFDYMSQDYQYANTDTKSYGYFEPTEYDESDITFTPPVKPPRLSLATHKSTENLNRSSSSSEDVVPSLSPNPDAIHNRTAPEKTYL